ncbi:MULTISPECIES: LysR substrate-binding domain-containing protein [unclassified Bradyrhizobium]|uniref:LysR substrate-binding domain-containing protein n=1 Tax=unclassified Bradyrhizobium TaxID=2631580 RepID=UPI001BAD0247|nr:MULTISPECIES: LysR substrate-binding domain-containing protein [unclassified Bradyrhizobium]MBR1207939.1 LysR family transcriptional regulator [Bradyrhizobium sp. AUGA SZCCT0124]MBR1314551.1 LysR family transcriptional regulator [Bradyrhizobium sp. AUGA SZCCT0051]MBR1342429.1 LysR family transcriptional regulator [Bradyrhizobium sp. AUGA SZCCT0105]MBR1352659.1 LysR family transcriptional regulator [Bradyrhizobium sp. AUGA SZCCT0045]
MELRHLRYFVALGEELNFTRAAERLHIAQPPLSQQIRQLEDELGVTLLQRNSRPIRLTEAGELFLERARALLASFESAVADTRRVGRGQAGKLAIGFVGSAMFAGLPDIIGAYRDACPDVELVLDEMLAAETAEALRRCRIDVGFARPALLPEAGLAQRLILDEPYVAALPRTHPLAARGDIALAELSDDAFVLYPAQPEPSVTGLIVAACQAAGFTPRLAQEVLHLQTAIGLIAAGVGVSLVPEGAARAQTGRGVSYVRLAAPVVTAPLTIAWREEDVSPAVQRLLDIVQRWREIAPGLAPRN